MGAERVLRIVRVDDWYGLYVDGTLRSEGHSIQEYDLLYIMDGLGLLAPELDWSDEYDEVLEKALRDGNESRMPERYDEVVALRAN